MHDLSNGSHASGLRRVGMPAQFSTHIMQPAPPYGCRDLCLRLPADELHEKEHASFFLDQLFFSIAASKMFLESSWGTFCQTYVLLLITSGYEHRRVHSICHDASWCLFSRDACASHCM